MHKVVITGPECSGKTTLTRDLAESFNSIWTPEYARSYVENLHTKYTYNDVEKIAIRQIHDFNSISKENGNTFIFFDTYLVITKVWFELVFGKCPYFVINELEKCDASLFLLCAPDLDWEEDRVRENPKRRNQLFEMYEKELLNYGFNYRIIKGRGAQRLDLAVKFTKSLL